MMVTRVEPLDATLRARRALAAVRFTLGAMFVWVFFENLGKGTYTPDGYASVINYYVTRGHAPAAWKAVMSLLAANAATAGPLQAAAEISFGVLLLLGAFTRIVALGAGAFLASLWVSELGTAWIWELLVPTLAALAISYGGAGRVWGIDAWLSRRYPKLPVW